MKKETSRTMNVLTHRAAIAGALIAAAALTGCALPDKPARAALYDFGPGVVAPQPTNRMAPLPALALSEVDASGLLDTSSVLYRLNYSDSYQLRPYALARWTMPPGQLIRQRMREVLGERRAVLNADEGAAQTRREGEVPFTLRVELEEFSQHFESPGEQVNRQCVGRAMRAGVVCNRLKLLRF